MDADHDGCRICAIAAEKMGNLLRERLEGGAASADIDFVKRLGLTPDGFDEAKKSGGREGRGRKLLDGRKDLVGFGLVLICRGFVDLNQTFDVAGGDGAWME